MPTGTERGMGTEKEVLFVKCPFHWSTYDFFEVHESSFIEGKI